jgi:hypothetical protein
MLNIDLVEGHLSRLEIRQCRSAIGTAGLCVDDGRRHGISLGRERLMERCTVRDALDFVS